jgi:hypothetical protein
MVALLFLFSPLDLPKRAAQWWQGHRWIVWYGRLLIGAVLLMVLMGVALSALREYVPAKLTDAAQFWATIRGRVFLNIWFQYAIAIVVLVLIITRSTGPPMGARRLLFGGHPALLFFPLCAVLNGLCPYLGLKTETSFAMYSNLRTEAGQSNHLIVRKPLSLADYQTNLVRIVDSSDEVLAKAAAQGLPIPLIEVRKRIWYMAAEGKSDIAAATGPRH